MNNRPWNSEPWNNRPWNNGSWNNRPGRFHLLDLLYPPRCPICDGVLRFPEHGCCGDCVERLPRIQGAVCMRCGCEVAEEEEYCRECRTQKHYFDRGAAAFTYTGALRHSVYRMKGMNRRDYIPFFAEEMVQALSRYLGVWRPELVLPVPMHPKRYRRRGYNQSELLALQIGRLTGIPVRKDLLRCTKLLPPQKELNGRERRKNLRGCFEVREPFPKVERVLLADDVYTTGSTMDEISRVLKERGVQSVYFVVLCTGKGKKGGMHGTKTVL